MNTTSLETTLKQLRLSGLGQTLSVRLQEAAANRLSHAEFLELILQDGFVAFTAWMPFMLNLFKIAPAHYFRMLKPLRSVMPLWY